MPCAVRRRVLFGGDVSFQQLQRRWLLRGQCQHLHRRLRGLLSAEFHAAGIAAAAGTSICAAAIATAAAAVTASFASASTFATATVVRDS